MKPELTKNQKFVLDILLGSSIPQSAYAILDEVRNKGIRSPLQVYRALEQLQRLKLVHRIESKNAFLACSGHCQNAQVENSMAQNVDTAAMFIICQKCENVEELHDPDFQSLMVAKAERKGFIPQHSLVEITGLCSNCNK